MRLKQIKVTKLFGMFDHVINLNDQDRITIIHGPNGYGKTAVLQMVRAILSNNFARLRRTPFEYFGITLSDSRCLSVTKIQPPTNDDLKVKGRPVLNFKLTSAAGQTQEYQHDLLIEREGRFPLAMIESNIPDLRRIAPDVWLQNSTGKLLEIDDVFEAFGDYLPGRRPLRKPVPDWLTAIPKEFDIRLIEAQRLLSIQDRSRSHHPEGGNAFEPAVSGYSKELASSVQEIQARYGTFSQQLDSTFPNRVIQPKATAPINVEALKDRLRVLEQKRQRIIAAGLLTTESYYSPIFDPSQSIDTTTQGILALYSEDVEQKLSVFTEVTEKIELFKELVNKRFSYKSLDIEAQTGFRLKSQSGGQLLPSDLSSGEQHELVLLYELLFKTKQNALILIDEPELSLHVGWQVEFLSDLSRVIKLSSFDVILATHSPQIINNRWDLTIELKGP